MIFSLSNVSTGMFLNEIIKPQAESYCMNIQVKHVVLLEGCSKLD